jgi:hypothetical protein
MSLVKYICPKRHETFQFCFSDWALTSKSTIECEYCGKKARLNFVYDDTRYDYSNGQHVSSGKRNK